MKKLSARWVPRLLTVNHKRDCDDFKTTCLKMFQHNPDEFLRRFITVDETWIHYFTSEMKEQSKQLHGTSSKEGEDRKVGRKGNGHSFLGCTRYNSYRLPSVEANNHGRLLRSLIGPFQQHFKEKTSSFGEEESAFPSRLCTDSHVPGTDGQIQRYELLSHPAFARFSSLRLFPVSKKNDSEERDSSLESSSLPKQAYFEGKLDESYYSEKVA